MAKWSKNPEIKARQKAARKAAHKERCRVDPAFRKRSNKTKSLRDNFGISLADYERMRELQDNMCGICDREPMVGEKELSVDHNHETRYIRGLLCFHCNVGIGHFQDSVPLLLRAIAWLTERNG